MKAALWLVLFCSSLLVTGASLAAEFKATAVAGHAPVFRWVKHLDETFIPAVNKALEGTEHSIVWDKQFGGSLAKVGDELEAIEEGLAEVGVVASVFDPAKLGVQNVTYYTPFVSTDSSRIANLIDELHESDPGMRATWNANGLVYLGGAIGLDDYMLLTTKPIATFADLAGLKIAAPGPAVNWLKGTGAVGVSGNLTTYYNEIKSGVYDGAIVFATAALPSKLYEVAPYIARVGFGAQYSGGLAANKDWFDSLPSIVQQALKEAATADRTAYLKDLDVAVAKALESMAANGATISDVAPSFRQQWADSLDNIARAWADRLDAEGQSGTAVLETYMNAMRASGAIPVRNWDQE